MVFSSETNPTSFSLDVVGESAKVICPPPAKDLAASINVLALNSVEASRFWSFGFQLISFTAKRYLSVAANVIVVLFISIWTPVSVGSESSLPAAIATWFTAVAKTSAGISPADCGSVGRFGYSFEGSVGSVNFALPAVTNTRVPSKTIVTGFAGSDLAISASNLPGTKTLPLVAMSALIVALVDVSKSEPVNVIESVTSIMIPRSAVWIGREDRLRATQFTASISGSRSTTNFIPSSFP